MATKYQIQCNVLPGTNEYFRDVQSLQNEDSIDFCFDQPVVIEDIIVESTGGPYSSGKIQIVYPESKAVGTIASSLSGDFYLNHKQGTPREANLWYSVPAKTILRFYFGTGNSDTIKACVVARS